MTVFGLFISNNPLTKSSGFGRPRRAAPTNGIEQSDKPQFLHKKSGLPWQPRGIGIGLSVRMVVRDIVAVVVTVGGFVLAVDVGVGMVVAVFVGMGHVAMAVLVGMHMVVLVVML